MQCSSLVLSAKSFRRPQEIPKAQNCRFPDRRLSLIDYISWHLLRNRLGTQLKNRGVPITETQMRLRHADVKTTLVYYIETEDTAEREKAHIASGMVAMLPMERACSPSETKRGLQVIRLHSTIEMPPNGAQDGRGKGKLLKRWYARGDSNTRPLAS